ncbi:DUF3500 domain-containing protein (plasmid) [Qipengyuania sp. HL-TH1]|jgi:hypothetical protein|uniref:DUF3500 domain-containing protein n=1 Tax=Qipengyuania profunda TaxID=3113984 RepID=UPI002A18C785|nr:DUF3500 domain-containing protein [Qipengyuania sp. HL-TH1]WPL55459.1 DUF3500 domain-containing protein [Qipengyuania sp. HL-TH5]
MRILRSSVVPLALILGLGACSSGGGPDGETVGITIADNVEVGASDAKAESIVSAAEAFLTTLSDEQRAAVVYDFDDNAQRARWSNFPTSFVERGGIMRKDLSQDQLAALDALLREVLSADGFRNARMQMAADDTLVGGDGPAADFGSGFYYVAFLGEPSTDAPWMLQFGGHHMAYNMTFVGAKASFSPMLTGGQPLTIQFEGKEVYITREEVAASRNFLGSLTESQRGEAIRGDAVINILLGPGAHGTVITDEGVRGADLDERQRELLLAVVEARVGQFNARDAAAKMAEVRATIGDTWFAWWGPTEPFGAAYFRVTGPAIMMEYGPQEMGDDITEHAHNMYRDPGNDYGARWIAAD